MIKAIFIDIDGTIRNDGKISDSVVEALKKLKEKQVKVILTTGRNFIHTRKVAREIDAYPLVIACNGSLVKRYDNNEVIFSRLIPRDVVRKVFKYSSSHDCRLLAHEENNNYYIRKSEDITTAVISLSLFSDNFSRMLTIKDLFKETIPSVGIVNSSSNLSNGKMEEGKVYFHDIVLANTTKSTGILETMDYLGLTNDEVMVIGDSYNDIPMAMLDVTSVATSNACLELKNLCNILLEEDIGLFLNDLADKI